MKTLKTMKLGVLSALFLIAMSSCIKDPDFGLTNAYWYMLQKNEVNATDTIPAFAPYIQLAANEQLASVVVTSKTFPAGVPGKIINYYFWETTVQSYDFTTEPEVENYTIAITNSGGSVVSHPFTMGINLNKTSPLGVLKTEFSYDIDKGLTVKWNAVKNANYYELWTWPAEKPANKIRVRTSTGNEVLEMTFSNYEAFSRGFEVGTAYKFELVAYFVENSQIQIKLLPDSGNQFRVDNWKSLS